MAVLGVLSYALEVPDIGAGVTFYTDAGLIAEVDGDRATFRCQGQDRASIQLIGGAPRKRLHHICLRAEDLEGMRDRTPLAGGAVAEAPAGFRPDGLWVRDPHGMLVHLVDDPADAALAEAPAFAVNGPGRIVRTRRSAVLPVSHYGSVKPLRLGHVLVFSPDVPRSVAFFSEALGMRLSDRAQDVIAFMGACRQTDHHVVAFAQGPGIGFHPASFQVADPDEVGRGGRALVEKAGRHDWGFGRHTIGSNFFHYIQDPWGSWFEYFSDMDYIDDYDLWTPTNYGMEDAMASWGPALPDDFVHNYEADPTPALGAGVAAVQAP
jgi:catechol 2,3-dioxygenase-like lactoylglutathione lyase family enzyme